MEIKVQVPDMLWLRVRQKLRKKHGKIKGELTNLIVELLEEWVNENNKRWNGLKRVSRIVGELKERLIEELTYLLENLKRVEYSIDRTRNLLDRKLKELAEAIKYQEEW